MRIGADGEADVARLTKADLWLYLVAVWECWSRRSAKGIWCGLRVIVQLLLIANQFQSCARNCER
jgi:hypothetical protein